MDPLDENIKNSLEKDAVIPEVVEQKCEEAFEFVRENDAPPQKKNRHLAAKIALPIAASLALVLGIGFANPAFAAQMPIVKDVFQLFKTEATNDKYNKDDLAIGDQGKYAKAVGELASQTASSKADTTNGVDLKVEQYSCNTTNLYVTYSAKVSNPQLADCDAITTGLLAENDRESVNGQEIHADQQFYLQRGKDGTFTAMQHYDLTQIPDLPDKFTVSVQMKGLVGSNSTEMVKQKIHGQNMVGPKETPIDGTWNFTFEVTKDTSHDKIYTVNQVKNGVKLNKVILTPGTTEIEYIIPDSMNDPAVVIRDNTGKKLNGIGGQDTPVAGGTLCRMKYAMTPASAKSLTITVIDKNGDSSTLATFTVPLKK